MKQTPVPQSHSFTSFDPRLNPRLLASIVFLAILLIVPFLSTDASYALQRGNPSCEYGTDAANVDGGGLRVVPTFHSLGVYWSPSGLSSAKSAHVLFGEVGSSEPLQRSLDLEYSAEEPEYRGSIVHLRSGTQYELTLVLDGIEQETVTAETWCEQFPVAETRYLPTGGLQGGPVVISGVQGSPDGYIVYTADPNGSDVLDGELVANNVVIEDSAYVILRGLTLRNAQQDAILLKESRGPVHDIVIENNTIEGWGRIHSSGWGEDDIAIRTEQGSQGDNFERLIIQRNIIQNPRADSNAWTEFRSDGWHCDNPDEQCHPKGPGGLFLIQTAGNHVIRYNEIGSSNGNYYNDAIGGGWNTDVVGNVHRDTDIYGNILANIWDDAIESEGGNVNVRIWGNYIEESFVAIANSRTVRGPLYVFRNLVVPGRYGPDRRYGSGMFMKSKSGDPVGIGVFVLHNTLLRHNGVTPISNGVQAWGTPIVANTILNNILETSDNAVTGSRCDDCWIDWNLSQGAFNGVPGPGPNGIQAAAVYGDDPTYHALAMGNPGHDDGTVIPNFSVGTIGAPDMGAQEAEAEPLQFGVGAYLVAATEPPAPEPEALPIRISAAATAAYTDSLGRTWDADRNYRGGNIVDRGAIEIAGTGDDPIYQTERWDVDGYAFRVENGDYTVRLHFAETWSDTPGNRIMDIDVESVALDDFEVLADAGFETALVKTFEVTVADGILDIAFARDPASGTATMVNGIEILATQSRSEPPPDAESEPTAEFSVACSDLACRFTDQSSDPDGTVAAWSWDLGDGESSTERSPSHIYAAAGSYAVTLTVADDDGTSSQPTIRTVTVSAPNANEAPTAGFAVSCTDLACDFTDQSNDADGTLASWSWDFGDGQGSTEQSPSHGYAAAGSYTVTLVVTDDDGAASAPASQSVTVSAPDANEPPTAAFAVSCTDLACDFTDQSSDSDGTLASWSWDFGDGQGSTEQSPAHGYAAAGSYTVTLTVTDDQGTASAPASQSVTVSVPDDNQEPIAVDQSVATEEDTPVGVALKADDPDGDPVTFSVDELPAHGFLSGTLPDVVYTPYKGYRGDDKFTFKASDGKSASAPATARIKVMPAVERLAVTSIFPETVESPSVAILTISGTGFAADAQVSFANGNGPSPRVTSVTVQSSTTLEVVIEVKRGGPPRERLWDVIVTSGGSSVAVDGGLTVLP